MISGTLKDKNGKVCFEFEPTTAHVARILVSNVRTTDPSSHPFKQVDKMAGYRVLRRPEFLLTRFDTQTAAQRVLLGTTATSNRGKYNRVPHEEKNFRDAQRRYIPRI